MDIHGRCACRLFSVIGLLVASVFPPISLLLLWNAVPAVSFSLSGPPRTVELCCEDLSEAFYCADRVYLPISLPLLWIAGPAVRFSEPIRQSKKLAHMSFLRNSR